MREKYKHSKAFALLEFHCNKCGKYEWIWNSGDHSISKEVNCSDCQVPMDLIPTLNHTLIKIPELTPLGIRWFVVESEELYTKRIKQQVKEMDDALFQDTDRATVEVSLINAYTPTKVYLVDPLTLNFEEQIEILLNTD